MKIPQFDLTRQYEQIEPEIQSAIRHVLRGGQFILGAEGEAFEAECAAYLGVKHAIGLGSGSDAIKLVLHALGVGPDTEVVTPAFSFVASATAALQLGARPVFVDIDPATFGLDPDRVSAAITPRTRVILAVHLYGLPAAMGPLRVLSEEHGVHLVEDAAQAFGATLGGRPVGGHGRAAAFSFYPTKNLAAYGDAGLVTTTDAALATHLRLARNHGQTQKYRHAELGWTARLDELQAAILRVKLRHLPAWTLARQAVAAPRAGPGGARRHARVPPVHDSHAPTRCARRASGGRRHRHRLPLSAAHPRPADVPRSRLRRELVSGGMGRRSGGALAPLLPGASAR